MASPIVSHLMLDTLPVTSAVHKEHVRGCTDCLRQSECVNRAAIFITHYKLSLMGAIVRQGTTTLVLSQLVLANCSILFLALTIEFIMHSLSLELHADLERCQTTLCAIETNCKKEEGICLTSLALACTCARTGIIVVWAHAKCVCALQTGNKGKGGWRRWNSTWVNVCSCQSKQLMRMLWNAVHSWCSSTAPLFYTGAPNATDYSMKHHNTCTRISKKGNNFFKRMWLKTLMLLSLPDRALVWQWWLVYLWHFAHNALLLLMMICFPLFLFFAT